MCEINDRSEVESWKAIPSTDGNYEASSLGRIRRATPSHGTRVGRILRCEAPTAPYVQHALAFPYGQRMAHLLVAEAFHGPCPPGLEVNHKDGKKKNNAPDNLEYVTHRENMLHRSRVLGKCVGEKHGNTRITEKQAKEVRALYPTIRSGTRIARIVGISRTAVENILRGKSWTYLGPPPRVVGSRKLASTKVIEALVQGGLSQSEIARRFGVSPGYVSVLANRKRGPSRWRASLDRP